MTHSTTRRTVLLGAGALAASANAIPAPALAVGADASDPRAFGARGEGQYLPLRSRYATLADAQATYPFASSLDQSLDWAGIQAALNWAGVLAGRVLVRQGRYVLSDSLALPNEVTLAGESRRGSIIDNQTYRLNAPQIVNQDPAALVYATIRDLTLNGGTHAVKIDVKGEIAGLVIEGVTAQLQSEANLQFSSVQTTVIRDCHLMHGRHAINVTGFPCNAIAVENCRLGAHASSSIRLRSADLFVMTGGSVEGGSTPDEATLDIETGGAYAQAITFRGVYFENTHAVLLRSRGTAALRFDGCKFSGAAGRRGLIPYRFDCGDDLIEFGSNHWDHVTVGPARLMVEGRNDGLWPPGHVWERLNATDTRLRSRAYTSGEIGRLLQLALPSTPSGQQWFGRLAMTVTGRAADGQHTVRDLVIALIAKRIGERLRVTASAGAPVSIVEAADGRSAVVGLRSHIDDHFDVEWLRYSLDGGASAAGDLLPLIVKPL